ncbi:MAG TPA: hypothetical protein VFP84_19885 [Kofleriaceae bacterium]|nr:hypothetical protein [Kofleriaceae bacterium]
MTAGSTGCHLRAGFDAASRINGPLHTLMASSTTSQGSGVTNLPTEGGRNYALEAGFGTKTITVNGLLAVHDVTSNSFTPGAGYLATTFGANVRWQMFDWHGLEPSLVGGPARMMLLDRNSGDRQWGNALRFGVGLQYTLGPVALYGDVYRQIVAFNEDTAAAGNTTLDGVTIGIALHP